MIDSGTTETLSEATALDQRQKFALARLMCARLMQERDDRKEAKRERGRAAKRMNDANRAKRKRLEKKTARETASAQLARAIGILREFRLDILQAAIRRAGGDKRLEQLVGRESDLAMFWQAQEQARHQHGAAVSDAQVAAIYCSLSGDAGFNRHKARSRRTVVQHLERTGGPWDRAILPAMLWPTA